MARVDSIGMSEVRDPAIKLFGRKIPLLEEQPVVEEGGAADLAQAMEPLKVGEKDVRKEKTNTEADAILDAPEDLDEKESLSSSGLGHGIEEDQKTATEIAKDAEEPKSDEQDNKESGASSEDKILKKPDKILQCPRCNSMDTKFCYYNNYNVNQPRHFCKNCQRYWTAGGTMRNVPVGAGRRKNKHSSSSYRHTVVTPEALASVQVEGSDPNHHEASPCGSSASTRVPLKCNGTVLKFGPDAPLCESMTSVLKLGDQKRASDLGFTTHRENKEEPSCSSSVKVSKHAEKCFREDAEQKALHGYQNGVAPLPQLQCYPMSPWAYAWNPGWSNIAAAAMAAAGRLPEPLPRQENGIPAQISWSRPPMVTAPPFCAPTFPFPLVPTSFWNCMPSWTGGPWNLPLVGNNNRLSPSSSTSNSNCSGNGSPTLGKHCREAASNGEEKTEKSLWVPKTLRIDDIDEAAKSSIFATLGIKPDEGGLFKAFPSKFQKRETADATQLMHANPAAFSRSQTFQETST